jgi:DNA-binding MarR family transcriptional regulator
VGRVIEPDFAILITAANRCVADRLLNAVATAGGDRMRPSFGFVLRAVAAEEPTVSRLAELLGVTKQAASRLADDMVSLGFLNRSELAADRRHKRLQLSATGERIRERALAESREMEDELRRRFGDAQVDTLRTILIDFVARHGGGDELAARRSRASGPS